MSGAFVVQFSGGITSWAAGRIIADKYPDAEIILLFADTYLEDQDCYRFVVEGAANILGLPVPDCAYTVIPEVTDMLLRKTVLDAMREQANAALPGLNWIADGRDVWQVFHAKGMMGNSRADMCSRILKRELLMKWIVANCDQSHDTLVPGLDITEPERISKFMRRYAWWHVMFPLLYGEGKSKAQLMELAFSQGVAPPRMYKQGFPHANCGGFCVKAGQQNFKLLLRNYPERYAYHEGEEEAFRERTGKDVSIMKDRRGGPARPFTMRRFREENEQTGYCDELDFASGCGCAIDD